MTPTPSSDSTKHTEVKNENLDDSGWILTSPEEAKVMEKMRSSGVTVGEQTDYISEGVVSGDNDVLFVDVEEWGEEFHEIVSPANGESYRVESEIARPLRDGDEIERYGSIEPDQAVIYPYEIVDGDSRIIEEEKLKSKFPKSYQYLSEFESRLRDRGSDSMNYPKWYALWCPRDKQIFEAEKLLVPDICNESEFALDDSGGTYVPNSAYAVVPRKPESSFHKYLLAVLNSTSVWFYLYNTSSVLRGDYRRFMTSYLEPIPVPDSNSIENIDRKEFSPLYNIWIESKKYPEETSGEFLAFLAEENNSSHATLRGLNTEFIDYIGHHEFIVDLSEIGIRQPPNDASSSRLRATSKDLDSLRVGTATVERESPNTVLIKATARYKPDDEDGYETDQWGYTETDYLPAFRITDLTETEADLIEHFVPVAVDEAGGFANFRETATKTNSLVDRLKAIELPDVDDVADDLENYLETVERAEELDEKIEKTDDLIDEIVYELYGLTDEEIEIVEEAVGE